MLIAVENTIQAIQAVVQSIGVGTNLALLQLMWSMLQGTLLGSRGAIFPALVASGFRLQTARRSWAALRYGHWQIDELIANWSSYVREQDEWQEHQHEGYRGVAVDLTAFWRPKLKSKWLGKHFHAIAGRALPAVVFGVAVWIGQIGHQRVPLPKAIVRAKADQKREVELTSKLLQQVGRQLQADEIAILDAGFKIGAIQQAQIKQAVVRLAGNSVAQRNYPKAYKGRGRRPVYGDIVRPLARTYKGRSIPATAADDRDRFEYQGRTIRVKIWYDLILPGVVPDPDNETFHIYLFEDPLYHDPLLLAATLCLQPRTSFSLYQDRWPVEQVPLGAKQMIGLHRHFVFAFESCQRLPELALLVATILAYLAATLPPIPTGFWDTQPKATPGRLRRLLARADFPNEYPFLPQLRKKRSVTDHLPKGIAAHRRSKAVT